jgi:hypothetical protein
VVELHPGAGAMLRVHLVGYDPTEVAVVARRLGNPE